MNKKCHKYHCHLLSINLDKKAQLLLKKMAPAYTVPVAVLAFKVVQSQMISILLVLFSPDSAQTDVWWEVNLDGYLMASCVRNLRTKNFYIMFIHFQVTIDNVGVLFYWDYTIRCRNYQKYQIFINPNIKKSQNIPAADLAFAPANWFISLQYTHSAISNTVTSQMTFWHTLCWAAEVKKLGKKLIWNIQRKMDTNILNFKKLVFWAAVVWPLLFTKASFSQKGQNKVRVPDYCVFKLMISHHQCVHLQQKAKHGQNAHSLITQRLVFQLQRDCSGKEKVKVKR